MIFTSINSNNIEDYLNLDLDLDYEFRLDTLPYQKFLELKSVYQKMKGKIITTIRTNNHDDETKLKIYREAISFGSDYLDIALSKKDLITGLKNSLNAQTKLIISYHNFEKTPQNRKISEIINKAKIYNPALIKIACRINTDQDNFNLLSFYTKYSPKELILTGMGEKGLIFRLLPLFVEDYLGYVSRSEKTITAPGQISLSLINQIREILKDKIG